MPDGIWPEDRETDDFCNDMLSAIEAMKADRPSTPAKEKDTRFADIRRRTGLTQKAFAELLGVSIRTLQSWEQGVRKPSGAAVTVLRIADMSPEVLTKLAQAPATF